ncbi:hypothetical protein Mal64_28630 [Pseudobythopirellula maris]|uniref:Uncharacterized protein n=1 Tax=Pseudobythopirellula maris TaxID=2527991 RepID=A0A5C5ZJN6_9BACT|nr:BBP7 family outer membrane beta-barrel protein [Pseudobythopirellula maris]TWT87325.1 hypothetical protein Mal64_28630 [Pseudobythopirellula maris]
MTRHDGGRLRRRARIVLCTLVAVLAAALAPGNGALAEDFVVAGPLVDYRAAGTAIAVDEPQGDFVSHSAYSGGATCPCGCGGCCGGESFWLRAETLLWRLSGQDLPPLVTASPTGTPLPGAGVLGDPSTSILYGGDTAGDGWRSGVRLSAGVWLDSCETFALVGDYFHLGQDGDDFSQGVDGDLIVTRPFFNTQTNTQDVQLISQLNELDGDVRVESFEELQGASIGLQQCLKRCCDPCGRGPSWRIDLVSGYRHYEHNSRLAIYEDLLVLPGTTQPLVPGTTIELRDQFDARNEFHGGEFGLKTRVERNGWLFESLLKVAVGRHRRTVDVDGSTLNTVPGAGAFLFDGGLLTSTATNIGSYQDTRTAVIPELRLSLAHRLTQRLTGRVGYSLIVWDEVALAADHLPPGLAVDPRNLPPVAAGGGPDPAFPGIQGSTLLAHGLDFGLELNY